MLQVNIGETVYPTFTVSRVTQIFQDRDSVLRYIYTHTGVFIWNFFFKKLHFIDKIFIFFSDSQRLVYLRPIFGVSWRETTLELHTRCILRLRREFWNLRKTKLSLGISSKHSIWKLGCLWYLLKCKKYMYSLHILYLHTYQTKIIF